MKAHLSRIATAAVLIAVGVGGVTTPAFAASHWSKSKCQAYVKSSLGGVPRTPPPTGSPPSGGGAPPSGAPTFKNSKVFKVLKEHGCAIAAPRKK
jgi:hypothetical protein